MSFEVKLEQFSGPLQLLLELIESEQLPITEVSLASVTDDYLEHVERTDVPAEELADFLVVATRLLLIKSRAILPQLQIEEEGNPDTLALQLKMYKEFVDASKLLEQAYGKHVMFSRPRVSAPKQEQGFFPPAEVTPPLLSDVFARLLKRLEPFFSLQRTSMERVASVQERVNEIREAILERSRMTFRQMVKGGSKVEAVVSFLALLELMKQRIIDVVQSDTFSEITIRHVD